MASSEPPTHGLNIIPFAIMAGGWLGPLVMFWLYVWGPLGPFTYPSDNLIPGAAFAFLFTGCVALWWLLPPAYFQVTGLSRTRGRLHAVLNRAEYGAHSRSA
jgi:hypothetical protein